MPDGPIRLSNTRCGYKVLEGPTTVSIGGRGNNERSTVVSIPKLGKGVERDVAVDHVVSDITQPSLY